jgi:uncharacterized protein
MAVFLALTWAGGRWESLAPYAYAGKTVIVAGLLYWLRGHYTKVVWSHVGLGLVVGVVGVIQWVGMEKLLLWAWPDYPRAGGAVFVPHEHFTGPALWLFVAVRLVGPTLVVPVMEELFWRDYLWRTLLAPNDFKLAKVGEWDAKVFVIVVFAFAGVHLQMWVTAIVWGLLIGWLLVRTKSLGACIVAHGVTNLLLGIYVLVTGDRMFW